MSVPDEHIEVVLVRARRWLCALPVRNVIETFRPLPVEPLLGSSDFVCGVAIVRGEPVPVVDLAALFGAMDGGRGGRFVTLRVGERQVVLEVDEVVGVHRISRSVLVQAPPLLQGASLAHVEQIGALDGQLLAVLDSAQLVSNELLLSTASSTGA